MMADVASCKRQFLIFKFDRGRNVSVQLQLRASNQ